LFGLALARWQAGASLADGLVDAARSVSDHGGGRLTMLAADGTSIAALVLGEPVHVLGADDGVVLASEPDVDGPWREIADGTAVHVGAGGLTETRL
jgi:predicted glutamine amidotransferase